MLALRGIILSISKLLALLFFTGTVLIFFVNDFHTVPLAGKIMMVTFGIIFTLINWFYDYLIFYFTPDDIDVRLYH
jgi:hypothetical protein